MQNKPPTIKKFDNGTVDWEVDGIGFHYKPAGVPVSTFDLPPLEFFKSMLDNDFFDSIGLYFGFVIIVEDDKCVRISDSIGDTMLTWDQIEEMVVTHIKDRTLEEWQKEMKHLVRYPDARISFCGLSFTEIHKNGGMLINSDQGIVDQVDCPECLEKLKQIRKNSTTNRK